MADERLTTPAGLPRRRRVPARFAAIVTPAILSVFMTCIVSLVSTLQAIGPGAGFAAKWLTAWGVSWLVAFPTLVIALPLVRRLTAALVDER
jgi:hypothetical protein